MSGDNSPVQREILTTDVVIAGAGPAGLSAAIRLKQKARAQGRDIDVLVLEKGSEAGAHILSGAVFDPAPLNQLLPNWQQTGAPLACKVSKEEFYYLGENAELKIPNLLLPPMMRHRGHYVISLGELTRWLGEQAQALGVEIIPGQPATAPVFDRNDRLIGVRTGDQGRRKDGSRKPNFLPGLEIHARYTLIAEGARGTLAEQVIEKYNLRAGRDVQKYGLGIKELWEIDPARHSPGYILHTLGWPLDNGTAGGGFLYHFGENLVSVGFVTHLNYQNPYLSPFKEFQRFKTHPVIRETFKGGRRIGYGARALTTGGWQSVPKLVFPGGALIGCAAGFMNVPRIQGAHNAMASGIAAADAISEAITKDSNLLLDDYETGWRNGPIGRDLKPVRNVKPLWSRLGTLGTMVLGGLDLWLNRLLPVLRHTLHHDKEDRLSLKSIKVSSPIEYPRADGVLTFDRLSSVALANTHHAEDQPVHIKLFDPDVPITSNLIKYDEPAQRYCPAAVFEILEQEDGAPKFIINAQNCIHCKTCEIKDPWGNITWVPPEGGGGPNYGSM